MALSYGITALNRTLLANWVGICSLFLNSLLFSPRFSVTGFPSTPCLSCFFFILIRHDLTVAHPYRQAQCVSIPPRQRRRADYRKIRSVTIKTGHRRSGRMKAVGVREKRCFMMDGSENLSSSQDERHRTCTETFRNERTCYRVLASDSSEHGFA